MAAGYYEKFMARSFSRYQQKKLRCGAFAGGLLIVLSIFTVFRRPYMDPLQVLNLRLAMGGVGLKMMGINNNANQSKPAIDTVLGLIMDEQPAAVCNFTTERSNFCEATGDIRIYGANSTVYYLSNFISTSEHNTSWHIRPYARKADPTAISLAKDWYITNHRDPHTLPSCDITHQVPAIIFSSGGYSGNHFHAFSDILIPLFLASRKYNGQVQFLITDYAISWVKKFGAILANLSNYPLINIDKDNEQIIRCFPRVRIGLESHKELDMDPLVPPHYSLDDFRVFLREAYSLNRRTAIKLQDDYRKKGGNKDEKPRLLILSRKETRRLTNEGEIVRMAQKLGFKVVVAEMYNKTDVSKFAKVVNSCDAMIGVHGAGLTNMVFLPDNAVFIQVVPLGKIEMLGEEYYASPAKDMKLKYLEYSIEESESSLAKEYPREHPVLKNPYILQAQGFLAFRAVYLDKQDVKLDGKRFKPTLVEALELLSTST